MFDDDIVFADFNANIEDVYDLLIKKDQLVDELAELLHSSWKSQFLTKEDEANIWFDFMEMPADFMHSMLGYLRIKNEVAIKIRLSDYDITNGHMILRWIYSMVDWTGSFEMNMSNIKGLIMALSIQKHLQLLEPTSQQSGKGSVSLLTKVRILYELGFFEELHKRNISENMEIGDLLTTLIGGDKDRMRRIAANIKEQKSDLKYGCDPFNTKTEKEAAQILNRLYPKLYPKAK